MGLKLEMVMKAVDRISAPLKKIKDAHKNLAQSVRELQKRIDDNTAIQKDIEKYRALKRQLKDTRLQYSYNEAEVKQLTERIEKAEKPTRKMRSELAKAQKRLTTLKGTMSDTAKELKDVKGKLSESGVATKNLSSHIKKLQSNTEKYTAALEKQKETLKKVQELDDRLSKARGKRDRAMQVSTGAGVAGAATMAVAQSVKQKVVAPLDVAAQFEAQMSVVKALSGSSPKEMEELTAKAREYGASTTFSAKQVGEAQEYLALAGFKVNDIMSALAPTLHLAQAGQMDLGQASDIASDTLSAFNMQAGEMSRLVDVLAATSTRTNTKVGMMGEAFQSAAGVAGSLGGTVEEVSALLGVIANDGTKASKAGTAISAMYMRLSAPPTEGRKALEELGLEIFDLEGKMRSVPEIFQELSNLTKDMSDEEISPILKGIFGAEASVSAASKSLLKSARKGLLLPWVEELKHVKGEGARVAQEMTDNYEGMRKSYESAVESLNITAGTAIMPIAKDFLNWLTDLVRGFDAFAKENPNLVKWLGITLGVLAAIMTVLAPIMLMISGLVGAYATFAYSLTFASVATAKFNLVTGLGSKVLNLFRISTWLSTAALIKQRIMMLASASAMAIMRNAQLLLNAVMMANPIGLVIAAVAGLIGLAALFVDDWGAIGDWFSEMWAKMMDYIDPLISKVKTFFSFFGGAEKEAKVTISKETQDKVTSIKDDKVIQQPESVQQTIAASAQLTPHVADSKPEKLNQSPDAVKQAMASSAQLPPHVAAIKDDKINQPEAAKEVVATVTQLQPKVAKSNVNVLAAGAVAASAALPLAAEPINTKQVEPLTPVASRNVTVEGDSIEINISTSGEINIEALTKLIRAEMDKRDQAKQQKIRGMLYDVN